jgi:hypothetical protein
MGMLFEKEYSFRGVHAERVIKLTAQFGEKSTLKLFASNVNVYTISPIVGFLYQRTPELDKTTNGEVTKIFPNELSNHLIDLKYSYQLIMLLDKKNESSFDERLNKAFRYYGNGSEQTLADEQLFEQYVRGGVDVLYEKLIENAINPEDYIKNLYDFMEEFNDRYNSVVTNDSIFELCSLARS